MEAQTGRPALSGPSFPHLYPTDGCCASPRGWAQSGEEGRGEGASEGQHLPGQHLSSEEPLTVGGFIPPALNLVDERDKLKNAETLLSGFCL